MQVETLAWVGARPGRVRLLDQTRLPARCEYLDVATPAEMIAAIQRLSVRGAPAIGVAGAYGLVLGVQARDALAPSALLSELRALEAQIGAARPTAINLRWGLARVRARAEACAAQGQGSPAILDACLAEARAIAAEDADQCRRIGEHGARLVPTRGAVMTHCNAGRLATVGSGTALAPIYEAARAGRAVPVFVCETRPLLQGARLTAWELAQGGIDVTLITDSMAGRVMYEGRVAACFVGADRIAANGDVCNKIGTYALAVLARRHEIPFYVAAPLSTFDFSLERGEQIPIEERAGAEVTDGFGSRTAPEGVRVYNPAFDLTPAELVTGIVTERGVIERPSRERLAGYAPTARG